MLNCGGERGRSPFVGGPTRKPWFDGYLTTSADASPISTAAGVLFLVIVTCSWVIDATSTKELSWFITLEIGSVCIQQW